MTALGDYATLTVDPDTRAAFVAGLLDLACFLESHPDVPVPSYGASIGLSAFGADDEAERRDVDLFAAVLGADITDRNGHYTARREFGPVSYEACAITAAATAAYEALQSYRGHVTPDSGEFGEVA